MSCEQGLRWLGGILQFGGVLTVALTVNSVRRKLGMDGVWAAAVRRFKGVFAAQRYPGARRGGKRAEPRERWPRLELIYPNKRDDAATLRREVTGHYKHLKAVQEELNRQRGWDQKQLSRLIERVEQLDRNVVKVIGGGTKIEAFGVVAFMLGIGLATFGPEICDLF